MSSRLGGPTGGAGYRVYGGRQHYNGNAHRPPPAGPRGTVGWEYVHIAIDDYSRLAYAEVLPDQKATTAIGFSATRWPLCPLAGIRSNAYAPITARLLRQRSTRSPARHSGSGICAHDHTACSNERESRALHPHSDSPRLALRRYLPIKLRAHRRP